MKKGMLISFEGGEACGKSTQMKKFKAFLEEQKIDYISAREPGGTDVGEEIRQILLHSKASISSETEFLLFSASRVSLIQNVIKPALEQGKVVVLDRYYDSSYTYQGYAGSLNLKDIKNITDFAIQGAVPDLTFYLDLSYEESMKRKMSDENLKNLDRMESKGREYHQKVRNGYLQVAKDNKERVFVIDASQSVDEIFAEIIGEFQRRYNA